jgi:hypothetical protein
VDPVLEIGIGRERGGGYNVELRFSDADSDSLIAPTLAASLLEPKDLDQHRLDPHCYGEALSTQLFSDPAVRAMYDRVNAVVESKGASMRLQLLVKSSAPELDALRWELLVDPASKEPIATSERRLFSRLMVSQDWRSVRLRARASLSALVVVSEPTDLDQYGLVGGYCDSAIRDAQHSLHGTASRVLGSKGGEPATLACIVTALRDGVDILYLMCHGRINAGVPLLYLQRDTGAADVIDGRVLARRIGELARPPVLAFLASCESAGSEDEANSEPLSSHASLAARLAEAGVQAIVAMQGRITVETIRRAVPRFFAEVLTDGRIERAMAAARGEVRERRDSWMPALYSRLKGGRIWYEPSLATHDAGKWPSLCLQIHAKKLVPIIGPDASERFLGTTGELAVRLADQYGYPMWARDRSNLSRVSQFIAVTQAPAVASREVENQLRRQVADRLRAAFDLSTDGLSLPDMLAKAAERLEQSDPCRALAELDLPVYVTTSTETTLFKALKKQGKDPTPLYCRWRKTAENHPCEPVYDGTPTPHSPIVYHAFGVIGDPESLVLTEDDFLDYIIAASTYKLIPTAVRGSLMGGSLLFLGFPFDDLGFRVLFRLIMTLDGIAALKKEAHVGVQVEPVQDELVDVQRARKYLEKYFETDLRAGGARSEPSIDIFWGSAEDFVQELRGRLNTYQVAPLPPPVTSHGWF